MQIDTCSEEHTHSNYGCPLHEGSPFYNLDGTKQSSHHETQDLHVQSQKTACLIS